MPTPEGVFCGQSCHDQFQNIKNSLVGTGPSRRRITLGALLRYALIVGLLIFVILGAVFALSGTTDPEAMKAQFGRTLRMIWPF